MFERRIGGLPWLGALSHLMRRRGLGPAVGAWPSRSWIPRISSSRVLPLAAGSGPSPLACCGPGSGTQPMHPAAFPQLAPCGRCPVGNLASSKRWERQVHPALSLPRSDLPAPASDPFWDTRPDPEHETATYHQDAVSPNLVSYNFCLDFGGS